MRTRRTRGFTVIEVLVALVVGALVIATARALLEGLTMQAVSATVLTRAADAEANRDRLVRVTFARAGVARDSAGRFEGTPDAMRFGSWCDMAGGWQEPCEARLSAEPGTNHASVTVVQLDLGASGTTTVLRAPRVVFRYLASAANGGEWAERWQSISAPLAVAVISSNSVPSRADTMLLRIANGY